MDSVKTLTISELAKALNATFAGDGSLKVSTPCPPDAVKTRTDIAIAMAPEYLELVKKSMAIAAIVPQGTDWQALELQAAIFVSRGRRAMADLTKAFASSPYVHQGIHPNAYVDPSAHVDNSACIGPFVYIGPDVVINQDVIVHAHASIAQGAIIGKQTELRAGVRITRDVRLGCNVLIHENSVIGADGFSFVTPETGTAETAKKEGVIRNDARNTELLRIYSLGAVTLEDNVEVGACTSIDRGTISSTYVGQGTKIDSSVQIGHNVQIGKNCMICGHVGIAGSAIIEDRCILAGKVGIGDHVKIGHDSVIGASSNVGTDVKPQSVMFGTPARPKKEAMQMIMGLRRLPRLLKSIEEIRERVSKLEN